MTFFLTQRSRAANMLFGDPLPKQSAAQAQGTIDPGKWLGQRVPQGPGQRRPNYLVPNFSPPVSYWIRRGGG